MEEEFTHEEALYMIEKLRCGSDHLRETLGRVIDRRDEFKKALDAIQKEATGPLNASYEYDATPTAEERLVNIVKIINDIPTNRLDTGIRAQSARITPAET